MFTKPERGHRPRSWTTRLQSSRPGHRKETDLPGRCVPPHRGEELHLQSRGQELRLASVPDPPPNGADRLRREGHVNDVPPQGGKQDMATGTTEATAAPTSAKTLGRHHTAFEGNAVRCTNDRTAQTRSAPTPTGPGFATRSPVLTTHKEHHALTCGLPRAACTRTLQKTSSDGGRSRQRRDRNHTTTT